MIVIRPATREEAVWLSSRLRSEDIQEIITATGQLPEEVVPLSFAASRECFTVRRVVSNKILPDPVAIFGVCDPPSGETGIVWFLGTRAVRLCALSVILESSQWLDYMSRRYPGGLFNIADSRNSLHVRWCQLTGFTLGAPIGLQGTPFIPIHRPAPLHV